MLQPFFLKNLQLSDINPRVCGINRCAPGEVYPLHYIQRYVLHYVTTGSGYYHMNGIKRAVTSGDIFVSRSGYATSYIADSADPFTYIWVSFECTDTFSVLLTEDVFSAPWAYPIFQRIIAANQTAAAELTICAQIFEFFALLSSTQTSRIAHTEDYVGRAINYIQTNFAEPIQLSGIAAALGLSRNYFCRLFKKQVGLSPQEYLVTYRLETAAKLLTEQGLSQKEAATRVGYPDVYTFSRMFKRKFGIPPGEYIRAHKNGTLENT